MTWTSDVNSGPRTRWTLQQLHKGSATCACRSKSNHQPVLVGHGQPFISCWKCLYLQDTKPPWSRSLGAPWLGTSWLARWWVEPLTSTHTGWCSSATQALSVWWFSHIAGDFFAHFGWLMISWIPWNPWTSMVHATCVVLSIVIVVYPILSTVIRDFQPLQNLYPRI